jgi:hypothetical protein
MSPAHQRGSANIYQEADTEAKRAAQGHMKPLFLVRKAS